MPKKKEIRKILEGRNNELTIEDISQYDLIRIADLLLKTAIENCDILGKKKWNEAEVKKARLVLGYLNSLQNAFGRKLQQIKIDRNIEKKVRVIQRLKKSGHFR